MNSSAWEKHPDYRIDITPCEHPMRILFHGIAIADSKQPLQLKEQDYPPVYYFPRDDVRMDLLESIDKVTHCPFKGDAAHWALTVEDKRIEIAAWSYAEPYEQVSPIKDYFAFYPEAIDKIVEGE